MTTITFPTRSAAALAAKSDARVQAYGWFVLVGYATSGWAYSCPTVSCRMPDIHDQQIRYRRAASGRWYTH